MGRRDAVQTVLEVVAECRRLLPSLLVTWEAGWETRGNGQAANYEFGNVHHTAVPSSVDRPFPTQRVLRDGRPDLSGPLCNFAGPWCSVAAPRLHVMAAHPANHAGASRASGPVPALSLYNPRTLGLEIDYAGSAPMTAGQMLVGHVWTRAVANVLARGSVEHVRGHAETSITGKWDPGYASGRTYDMTAWRRTAAALAYGGDTAPAPAPKGFLAMLTDAQQADLYRWTRQIATELMGPDWATAGTLGWPMARTGVEAPGKTTRRTSVQMLMESWVELTARLDAAGRPGASKDTLYGQALSARALAAQALEQARLGATRDLSVDVSAIDWSRVQLPAPVVTVEHRDLSDADVDRIARRVDELLAARLAS